MRTPISQPFRRICFIGNERILVVFTGAGEQIDAAYEQARLEISHEQTVIYLTVNQY
jgi:hypothetical protein